MDCEFRRTGMACILKKEKYHIESIARSQCCNAEHATGRGIFFSRKRSSGQLQARRPIASGPI